jgi:hypothetical protein
LLLLSSFWHEAKASPAATATRAVKRNVFFIGVVFWVVNDSI